MCSAMMTDCNYYERALRLRDAHKFLRGDGVLLHMYMSIMQKKKSRLVIYIVIMVLRFEVSLLKLKLKFLLYDEQLRLTKR